MMCLPWRFATYEALSDIEIAVTPWRSETLPGSARVYNADANAAVTWVRADDLTPIGTGHASPSLKPAVYLVSVAVCDNRGQRAQRTIRFRVETEALPVIQQYSVQHASSETAWDGEVTATVLHAPLHVKYAWSNGAITRDAVLRDLPPGEYSCTPVDHEHNTMLPHIHLAPCAAVGVGSHT